MIRLSEKMSRLATESAFEVLARADAIGREGREVINLGIGQPDFPTAPHIVEAAVKAMRDGHHGYTAPPGITALREAVAADLLRRHGVEVSPGRVVVVPGGKVTMFFAILMFGEPGVEIVYPDPGFPIYKSVIDFSGATPVPYGLPEARGFSFDADEVLAAITPRTRLLVLNSPGNPTGGAATRQETDRLVAGLEAHPDVAVLSDEIYSRLTYDGREHPSLLAYPQLHDRLVLLDGWSKTYCMTGWRLGYGVWPESIVGAAERLAVNCHSCVNAATQYAGIAALDGPQDSVAAMQSEFEKRRAVMVDGLNSLPGVSCRVPGGAFYAHPDIRATGMTSREFQDRMLEEAAVATLGGDGFGARGEGYVRFSFANTSDNIRAAIERIRGVLER